MSDDPVLAALGRIEAGVVALGQELRGEMTQLRVEVTQLRVETMGRFEKVENRLTMIQDDIAVNMGGVSTVFDRQVGMRKESDGLSTESQALHRMIKRLQTRVDELEQKK